MSKKQIIISLEEGEKLTDIVQLLADNNVKTFTVCDTTKTKEVFDILGYVAKDVGNKTIITTAPKPKSAHIVDQHTQVTPPEMISRSYPRRQFYYGYCGPVRRPMNPEITRQIQEHREELMRKGMCISKEGIPPDEPSQVESEDEQEMEKMEQEEMEKEQKKEQKKEKVVKKKPMKVEKIVEVKKPVMVEKVIKEEVVEDLMKIGPVIKIIPKNKIVPKKEVVAPIEIVPKQPDVVIVAPEEKIVEIKEEVVTPIKIYVKKSDLVEKKNEISEIVDEPKKTVAQIVNDCTKIVEVPVNIEEKIVEKPKKTPKRSPPPPMESTRPERSRKRPRNHSPEPKWSTASKKVGRPRSMRSGGSDEDEMSMNQSALELRAKKPRKKTRRDDKHYFDCHWPGCGYELTVEQDLEFSYCRRAKHAVVHTDIQRYYCPTGCGFTSQLNPHMKTHILKAHGKLSDDNKPIMAELSTKDSKQLRKVTYTCFPELEIHGKKEKEYN